MHPHSSAKGPELFNLLLAIVLATAVMFGWQYLYERPRKEAAMAEQAKIAEAQKQETSLRAAAPEAPKQVDEATLTAGPRLSIDSETLQGSMSISGRLDDLAMKDYHETRFKKSPAVKLLHPAGAEDAYFAEVGVLSGNGSEVPTATTRWKASGDELTPETPVTLSWSNGAGVTFEKTIALDKHYLFTITTRVKNASGAPLSIYPYGLIRRHYEDISKHNYLMHEGPLGTMNQVLNDVTYKELREDGEQQFSDVKGWIGITDKYWLTALIPDQETMFDAQFKYYRKGGKDTYQTDLRGEEVTIAPGETHSFTVRLFAGAKQVKLLDQYRLEYGIPLFDRAVDFGSLYFLTKPIFFVLSYFYALVGNFGVAILLLTICIRILLFPLANKSFTAMSRMRMLMPQMTELKDKHADDKMMLNKAIMEMYKKEKVNPMSGCLPLLLQIPVFFALYRVLFTTIEMRHAPFFGWIKDLSAPDPTSVFNLFGLIPWDPPSFLMIGVLPILMCLSMVLQQKLNPKPADPIQAAVIGYMPYVFLFLFASFPAGLVLYWAWNNVLSILQQLYINHKLKKKGYK